MWKPRKRTQKQLVLTFVPILNFFWFLCNVLCPLDVIVGLLIRVFPIHVELLPSSGMKQMAQAVSFANFYYHTNLPGVVMTIKLIKFLCLCFLGPNRESLTRLFC